MTNVTEAIASFAVNTALDDIPSGAMEKAKRAIADTFACILAGAASELADPLRQYIQASGNRGSSPVLGTGLTAAPETAAFVNGTFGHALDFDDVLSIMPAHPSAVILSSLFAGIGPGSVSGRRLLEAYLVGLETGAKIGVAIGQGHYRRGWHATGTLTVFAAVAALARLKGLSVAATGQAFGIGASMASGIQRNFGTMTKPAHSGMAARSAVAAVELAASGFTAHADVFDGEEGFFAVYGDQHSDLGRLPALLGRPWAILDPGLSLKKYPCVYAVHRAIDAILYLRERHHLSPETVELVTCLVPPGSVKPLKYTSPRTGLEAKFCMEYALGAGLLDGEFNLRTFTDEAVNRPAIRALLPRMVKREDPYCISEDPEAASRSAGTKGFIEVQVLTRSGDLLRRRVDKPVGSPQHELTWEQIRAKFCDCAASAGIDSTRSATAFNVLEHLEGCEDMLALVQTLA